MTPDLYASMAADPRYQQTVQKLMQAHPAIKAVVNLRPADEAFMQNTLTNQLQLGKMGLAKRKFAGEYALESGLGLSNLAQRYDIAKSAATSKLALEKSGATWSNVIGAANVGVSGYGLNQKYGMIDKLNNYYLNKEE